MDKKITFGQAKVLIVGTCNKRGWKPKTKDIAISISLEAGELLEHFQFKDAIENREELALEVADVVFYLFELCEREGIDISEALKRKIKKIDEKYPADKIKKLGRDFYYEQKKKYRANKK